MNKIKRGCIFARAMIFNLRFLLGVLLFLFPGRCLLYAQEMNGGIDTIKVTGRKSSNSDDKKDFTAGQASQTIDKRYRLFYLDQSLSQLIGQQSSVFVKTYGVNSLSTLSLRGASAAQSAVLWNGVPVMSPALGMADISLLQTGLFDNITLQYGSSGALYGSGNVGGALTLNDNIPDFYGDKKQLTLSVGGGSFGNFDAAANAYLGNSKWNVSFKTFYRTAQNNFEYEDGQGRKQMMSNARLDADGLLFSIMRNLNKGDAGDHYLGLDIWYQQYFRELPPALFEAASGKKQTDRSLRTLLHWDYYKNGNSFYVKLSLNRESLLYNDDIINLNMNSHVWQYYQELGYKRNWQAKKLPAHHELLFFAPLQYAAIQSKDTGNHSQFRPAIAAAYKLNYNRFDFNANLRQEWWGGNVAPLLPGAGAAYEILNIRLNKYYNNRGKNERLYVTAKLKANVQRTYRIPTLNELYNFPGGNAGLKPEQGWSKEGGYVMTLNRAGTPLITHELVYFNRDIKDWIIWLGGAIWTPHNLAEVHSRGLETRNSLEIPVGRFTVLANFNTTYVLSTNKVSYLPGDSSIGRQIPYTPRYVLQCNAGLRWRNIMLNYNHTYTGYRFITMDESQYLEPYHIGNIQAVYGFRLSRADFRVTAQVQNVWDQKYEVVAYRPMPGRYFLLALQYIL